MPDGYSYTTIGAILIAFAVAAIVVRIAHTLLHRMVESIEVVSTENRASVRERAQRLVRTLTLLAYGIAALGSISLALTRFGIHEVRWDPRLFAGWFATHGINVFI